MPLRAAALHLDLLTIHPFSDGNGRSSRLIAAYELLRGGFRSSLFTAVEQHFAREPAKYVAWLDDYRFGRISRKRCLWLLVSTMRDASAMAASFRARAASMREQCVWLGLSASDSLQAMTNFDAQRPCRASRHLSQVTRPWPLIQAGLSAADVEDLRAQLERLAAEESADAQLIVTSRVTCERT